MQEFGETLAVLEKVAADFVACHLARTSKSKLRVTRRPLSPDLISALTRTYVRERERERERERMFILHIRYISRYRYDDYACTDIYVFNLQFIFVSVFSLFSCARVFAPMLSFRIDGIIQDKDKKFIARTM